MIQKVDEVLKHIFNKYLTETMDLIRSTSILVGEMVGKEERQ